MYSVTCGHPNTLYKSKEHNKYSPYVWIGAGLLEEYLNIHIIHTTGTVDTWQWTLPDLPSISRKGLIIRLHLLTAEISHGPWPLAHGLISRIDPLLLVGLHLSEQARAMLLFADTDQPYRDALRCTSAAPAARLPQLSCLNGNHPWWWELVQTHMILRTYSVWHTTGFSDSRTEAPQTRGKGAKAHRYHHKI